MNSCSKKILFILILIFILFLGFYLYFCKKNIFENYDNINIYDKYFITNKITDNVIVIEQINDGINISIMSSGTGTIEYTNLNMHLSQNHSDILDVNSINGQYWCFNYNSEILTENPNTSSSCKDQGNIGTIDLSQYDSNQIFEEAIFFENGTMITFDYTGTHMIIENIPKPNSNVSVQTIFALSQYDYTNLNGNSITLLYYNGKAKVNNFFYKGSCNINSFGTSDSTENNINFMKTLAFYSPTNQKVSILGFNNGCFIDGSQSGSLLRFIGISAVIQFDFSGNNDILEIWNLTLSNYFYYNTKNEYGVSNTENSIYNTSQSNRNYWNMRTLGMFPYTESIQSIIKNSNTISYSNIDQIIIYNPQSQNNLAILIQVDTCPYGQNQGNNLPQGSNNWSLTISSIVYNSTKKTISINPKAVSKFSFNLNCGEGDIIDFIVNNGESINNTMYFYYNSNNVMGNNKTSKSSPPSNIEGKYGNGGTDMNVFPNNMPFKISGVTLPSQNYPYAFRNNPPNQLIFENTINFTNNLKMGIDINGNCILKGNSCQAEFNIAKTNMGGNLNIFGISKAGGFVPQYNNFIYNGKTNQTAIGYLFNSGIIQVLEYSENQTCFDKNLHIITETTGNYNYGTSIPDEENSNGGPYWSCQSMEYNLKNGFILQFSEGYQNSYGEMISSNTIALLDYNITPSTLVSEASNNIINGTIQNLIYTIEFSNGIEIIGNNGLFQISGLYGSFSINSNNNSNYLFQIQNNSIQLNNKNNNNNLILTYENNDNSLEITP